MQLFNPIDFRQDFPSLKGEVCYLDSATTTLTPSVVIETMADFYRTHVRSIHQNNFSPGQALTRLYEDARDQVARCLNVSDAQSIVWTKGTTESINLVAQSWLRSRLQPGDEIIVSEAEHHANLIPWLMVAKQTGATVVKLPLGSDRLPDVSKLSELLKPHYTRLLAIGQMSNVTGGCPDLVSAITQAHACGAVVMVDGAQGIAHYPINIKELDVDFYAFSAHKFYGPAGIGVLYGKTERLREMEPWQGGGHMVSNVSFLGFKLKSVPWCLEAGTPNIAGVIGTSTALQWFSKFNQLASERWSQELAETAESLLIATIPGFESYRVQGSSLLSFNIASIHGSDLATLLMHKGISLRAGHHCAIPLLSALGITSALRASFAPYNTYHDIHALVHAIQTTLPLLG
ncbi:Cysteine desulfurase CsdA [Candidatus Erwinia haradaeae]|uniref:cysteine desulfurase n=1 Tax=Candidatus Erwinia haradaeae TaxID=1922217 RepID=A0A451DDI9_9GAMM|nr:cysteine desulfurase CsdA [Candidatus Erwinia haradaeae]VFP84555.1 Cysteine desulfurase CsdA [Candidatus Erwinia haradaeae]